MTVAGLVLAAGGGLRFGGPKALAVAAGGEPWTARGVRLLRDAGCGPVLVVLGAEADAAGRLLPPDAQTVVAERWADGMGASLAAGLEAVAATAADAALVTLVDLPDLSPDACRRVLRAERPAGQPLGAALRRAVYAGRPGHPVLVGRDHLLGMAGSLHGDSGGRDYLAARRATAVECGDLGGGIDVDTR